MAGVDTGRIERAVHEILLAIGEDPDRDGLQRTPARVARAYAEMFAGLRVDPTQVVTTTFEAEHVASRLAAPAGLIPTAEDRELAASIGGGETRFRREGQPATATTGGGP